MDARCAIAAIDSNRTGCAVTADASSCLVWIMARISSEAVTELMLRPMVQRGTRGCAPKEVPSGDIPSYCHVLSISMPGNNEGLVPKPEPAVLVQDVAGNVEVTPIADYAFETRILDLPHVDRCVPSRKQRRRADRRGHLGG